MVRKYPHNTRTDHVAINNIAPILSQIPESVFPKRVQNRHKFETCWDKQEKHDGISPCGWQFTNIAATILAIICYETEIYIFTVPININPYKTEISTFISFIDHVPHRSIEFLTQIPATTLVSI